MPTEIDKPSLLARTPLFSHFRPDELNRLVSFLRVSAIRRAGMFRKGDPGTNMMVVLQGRVQICTRSAEGKEFVVNIINPGEVFGEIALLDGSDRTADAVTMDACELMVLERRDFVPFLKSHPDACMRLLEVLCQKLRWTTGVLEAALFSRGRRGLPGSSSIWPACTASRCATACSSTSGCRSSSSPTWSACRARASTSSSATGVTTASSRSRTADHDHRSRRPAGDLIPLRPGRPRAPLLWRAAQRPISP